MKVVIRSALAALAALVWSYFVLVFASGVLAAVQVPSAYFRFFGPDNKEFAHFVLQAAIHGLPTVLLLAVGVLVLSRITPVRGLPRHTALSASVAFAVAVLLLYAAFGSPWGSIPWWSTPSLLAPWAGIAFGWYLLAKSTRNATNAA